MVFWLVFKLSRRRYNAFPILFYNLRFVWPNIWTISFLNTGRLVDCFHPTSNLISLTKGLVQCRMLIVFHFRFFINWVASIGIWYLIKNLIDILNLLASHLQYLIGNVKFSSIHPLFFSFKIIFFYFQEQIDSEWSQRVESKILNSKVSLFENLRRVWFV